LIEPDDKTLETTLSPAILVGPVESFSLRARCFLFFFFGVQTDLPIIKLGISRSVHDMSMWVGRKKRRGMGILQSFDIMKVGIATVTCPVCAQIR